MLGAIGCTVVPDILMLVNVTVLSVGNHPLTGQWELWSVFSLLPRLAVFRKYFFLFFVGQELKGTDDIFSGISNTVLVSRSILVLLDLLHFPYATSRFAGVCYKKPAWKKVHLC